MRDKDALMLESLYNKVVKESSYPIGKSEGDNEMEFDWTDKEDPILNGYWIATYDYDASGSYSSGSYDEPPGGDIKITIEYLKIEKAYEDGTNEVVYNNENLKELKVSNPDLYRLVSAIKGSLIEKEEENEDNYEQDYRNEPDYDSYDY